MDSEKCDKTVDEGISKFAFEHIAASHERTVKRLWVIILILLGMLFVSNALWLYVFNQYDFESYDYEQDGSGINIIGDENEEVKMYGAESKSAEDDKTDRRNRQDEASEN